MPEPTDDLVTALRGVAIALDEAAPPIPAAEVRRSPAAPPRRWVPLAAAAAFVLVVGGVAWAALTGDDAEVLTPVGTTTTTTTTTTGPSAPHGLPTDLGSLPEAGIAIQEVDSTLTLYDLSGNPVGRISEPAVPRDGYEVVLPSGAATEPFDPAEVPDGCDAAFGGGGVRVAICGSGTIDVVDAAGERRRLTGTPFDETSGEVGGDWRWALPSPDGAWVLAQWVDEACTTPTAYVTSATGEGVPLLPVGIGVESFAVGWAPDGRAIVQLGHGECGTSVEDPGVYLLDPASMELELLLAQDQPWRAFTWRNEPSGNGPERLVSRALRELGLEPCCGEPSHGGDGVTSGAVFEGQQIGIGGVPAGSFVPLPTLQTVPLLHGEAAIAQGDQGPVVAFACGTYRFRLSWQDEGSAEVDSMLLLAEALVPHLACTLGPPP